MMIERNYGDPIINLKTKGVSSIVYNYHILKESVREDSQVLNIHSLQGLDAVVPEELVVNVLVLRIQVIQDGLCVTAMGGSEYYYFKVL
jgi:hypothetical protein